MFHILPSLKYIQQINENNNNIDMDINTIIHNIQILYNIMFSSIDQVKAMRNSNINEDIQLIIIQFM